MSMPVHFLGGLLLILCFVTGSGCDRSATNGPVPSNPPSSAMDGLEVRDPRGLWRTRLPRGYYGNTESIRLSPDSFSDLSSQPTDGSYFSVKRSGSPSQELDAYDASTRRPIADVTIFTNPTPTQPLRILYRPLLDRIAASTGGDRPAEIVSETVASVPFLRIPSPDDGTLYITQQGSRVVQILIDPDWHDSPDILLATIVQRLQ